MAVVVVLHLPGLPSMGIRSSQRGNILRRASYPPWKSFRVTIPVPRVLTWGCYLTPARVRIRCNNLYETIGYVKFVAEQGGWCYGGADNKERLHWITTPTSWVRDDDSSEQSSFRGAPAKPSGSTRGESRSDVGILTYISNIDTTHWIPTPALQALDEGFWSDKYIKIEIFHISYLLKSYHEEI